MKIRCNDCMAVFDEQEIIVKGEIEYCSRCGKSGCLMDMEDASESTSVFTDILTALAGYSAAVDTGAASHNDFTDFQKLEARIINAYQTGYFKHTEYRTLYNAYSYIKAGFRVVLGLDK